MPIRTFVLVLAACCGLSSVAFGQESFSSYLKQAMRRDYTAQRNTAFCLHNGDCDGDYGRNQIEACAWRMIILASGHREVDGSDVMNYQSDCLSMLSSGERSLALGRAEKTFRQIYHREMPLDTLLAANHR